MSGPVAVVRRMPDGRHGVRVIDARAPGIDCVTLPVAEWRALLPKIAAACDLAERPGELPAMGNKP